MIRFNFQNILDIGHKTILVSIMVICVSFSISSNAQNAPKIWDESNSELKINSPLITELETDQAFYLRYTQNLDSFDLTKSIDWKIQDASKNVIYSRHLDSNQDKNEPVKIQNPGTYSINLNLKIDSNLVTTTRNIKIIPKDALYYSGLRLNEISPSTSQIELYNDSDKDIDTSSLLINYNSIDKFNLSTIGTVPSKSYDVIQLKNPIKITDKIDLVFEKNQKQSEQQIIDSFIDLSTTDPKSVNKDYQFDTLDKTWKSASPTLGQLNKFELVQEAKNTQEIKGNFQKSETVRTGGFDQSILSILPLLILLIAYIITLAFEKKEKETQIVKNLNHSLLRFLTSLEMSKVSNLNLTAKSLKSLPFAKIRVNLQNCITWLEVFSLSAILHLQTL